MRISSTVLLLLVCAVSLQAQPTPVLVVKQKEEAVSVGFSPDGKILAGGSGYAGCILFWDSATGKVIRRLEGETVGDTLAFSPDGKTLATVRNWQKQEGSVHLWDVATGKATGRLEGGKNLTRCVAFSPDGKLLAAHSQWGTKHAGSVRVWEVATGKEVFQIPTNSAGHTIAFSPDGKLLAFDIDYTIRLCETATGKELHKLTGHQQVVSNQRIASGYLNALAFSPDGKVLASASCDGMARLWEVASGKTLHVLEGHRGFVNAVAFFPDGKTVVTGGEDGTIRCWQAATGKQLSEIQAHGLGTRGEGDQRKDVFALAFSPDGKKVASGGRDTAVKVWEASSLLKSR